MAVKDVFSPGATNPTDPKKPNEKEGEWGKKAKDAKAEREYLEEQKRIDRMAQAESSPQQPAVEMTGKVHFDVDPQRDADRARQEMKEHQEKSDKKVETLTGDLDKTKSELQDSRITVAMKEMAGQFTSALREMNDKIAAVKSGADPAILATQYASLAKVAESMGYQKSTPQIGDPAIQLEITRLNIESARLDREHKDQLEKERRDWDLEKMKLEDDRDFRRSQLAQEATKNEMFAKAPQYIGGAIAQGLLANQGKGGRVAEETSPETKAPKGKQGKHVEADWGDSGEVECPGCDQPIAIGPTARTAVCANCGESVPIKRTGERPSVGKEEG